jgi:hypothetical protein
MAVGVRQNSLLYLWRVKMGVKDDKIYGLLPALYLAARNDGSGMSVIVSKHT